MALQQPDLLLESSASILPYSQFDCGSYLLYDIVRANEKRQPVVYGTG